MAKKNILIVGNKLIKNLKICNAIDSFDKIFRCNLATVGSGNGFSFGSLAMCDHVYNNFVTHPKDKSEIMDLYESEYEYNYLSEWFDFFQNNKDNFEEIFYQNGRQQDIFNKILKEYDCPYIFDMMPTTGYSLVMSCLRDFKEDYNIFVSNFTIDKEETRETLGSTEPKTHQDNSGSSCHSFTREGEILRWLHNNNIIDASLCLLNDNDKPELDKDKDGLKVSDFISNLINNI